MDIANFIIGQLVGLAEPLLVLGFIIKCLGWKESIKHQKRIYIGASLFVFLVAQGNGRFPGSYVIIIAIDVELLCIFSLLFLTKNSVMKIMICILAEVINLICPLIVMQVTSYIINTSIFDFLQNEGSIFAAGAIVSKILLWLVYKGLYSSFQYLVLYFPKEQIILTIVLVGFAVISENCIFLAVSQKGVSHYTVILLLIVSFDGQVNMVATQEEIEYWKGYVEKHIDDQKAVLTGINQKYDMCCNDSYNTINMYYDQELSFKKAFSCVGKTAIYCAMYQILDGNPDYSIYLNIYNVDTGKLVVGGNLMNEEVSYTDEDWEKTF